MGVVTHVINASGLGSVQMYIKCATRNSLCRLERIWEHSIRLIALTRSARMYLGV